MHTPENRPFLSIVRSPPPVCAPPIATTHAARSAVMDFHELRQLLRMEDDAVRQVINYVRDVTAKRGFPAPRNPRKWSGKWVHGAEAVCQRSKWDRYLVERWLDGTLPPAHAAAAIEHRALDWRAQLAGNAAKLTAVNAA